MNDITYVGLDVHKATVCVAIAESGRGGEVRQVGVFENRPDMQNGGSAWQGSAASQLLLRRRPLRLWPSSFADRFGARLHRGGAGRPGRRSPVFRPASAAWFYSRQPVHQAQQSRPT